MPDAFGFETPEEVSARIRLRFSERAARIGAATQGARESVRTGASVGALLAPFVQAQEETSAARKVEVTRLIQEEGLSKRAARARAKQTIETGTDEQRQAKLLQKTQKDTLQWVEEQVDAGRSRSDVNVEGMDMYADVIANMPGMAPLAKQLRERAEELRIENAQRKRDIEEQNVDIDTKQETLSNLQSIDPAKDELTRLQNRREKLIELRQLSPNSPLITEKIKEVDSRIEKIVTIIGRTDADERALTPATINSLQKSLLESGEQLDLLYSIGERYDPRFLTWGGQFENWWRTMVEKGTGAISPEGQEFVTRYSAFKRNALDGLNRYIKLITGAQMSEAEADRLRKAFPDVENDSGTQFMAKYVEVVRQILAVRRRAMFAETTGDLTMLPADYGIDGGGNNFGADLLQFMPTEQEVLDHLGILRNDPKTVDDNTNLSDAQVIESWLVPEGT